MQNFNIWSILIDIIKKKLCLITFYLVLVFKIHHKSSWGFPSNSNIRLLVDKGSFSLWSLFYFADNFSMFNVTFYHILSNHEQTKYHNVFHDSLHQVFEVRLCLINIDLCHFCHCQSQLCSQLLLTCIGLQFHAFNAWLLLCFTVKQLKFTLES